MSRIPVAADESAPWRRPGDTAPSGATINGDLVPTADRIDYFDCK
jgi:hypothetical protein